MNKNYDIIIFVLRSPGDAAFADIIKIVIKLIEKTFKDSLKVKRIKIYVLRCSFSVFTNITKIADF